jgi:hypothetical protein
MTMPGITRKPAFWMVYALVSAAALAVAWRLFPLAIPLVNLDIKLARGDAVAQAERLAFRLDLSPDGARSAARFANDQAAQNYIELEGGGKPAFGALVAGDIYAPYWWEVRLFKPGDASEAMIRFRPDGTPYGFVQKVPERFVPANPDGLALDPEAARGVAEDRASADWGVDFTPLRLLEKTQQRRTTGRVDHSFVYERVAGNLVDSRFRLRLAVTGDALTEVTHYVFVPESFTRRFQSLRSANDTIAIAASLSAGLLYGIGGCILGVLWLLRRHWLVWRPAVAAGFAVGGLLGAAALANSPAAWFEFDTAQSTTAFWLRQAGTAAGVTFAGGLVLALVFMAAESLSRRAFPDHPQLWRVWSRDAAPSVAMLGRTVGGYLFVPLGLAFVFGFYYVTNQWFGWWQPSEALTDPNILGSAVPALLPIAISVQAGFMEECLFRAVPLSLAALVGTHYGRCRAAIAIAIVIQALVFAGAHANYPGFPSYSRLVELFVPSVLWALIFVRFGLIPTILLHALFDLVLISSPLFLLDAPGSDLSRALVIAAGLVPIAVVLARRIRVGAWIELSAGLRNGAWQPTEASAAPAADAQPGTDAGTDGWAVRFQRALPVLGIAGLAAWALATPFATDVPSLLLPRQDAEAKALAALAARGVTLGPEWRRASVVRVASDIPDLWQGHQFVWREGGHDGYAKLVGNVLAPPLWEVRWARFDGEVADRAEEWRATIDGGGAVRQIRHMLPEDRPGAHLARDDARALAVRAVRDRFGLDATTLSEIGAEEKQQPARTDWTFVFAEPDVAVGAGGEARIGASIAGDEIVALGRFVFVPEAWQRGERDRDSKATALKLALAALLGVAGIAAIVMGVVDWTNGRRDRRVLYGVAGWLFLLGVLGSANAWPTMEMNLRTAEPLVSQVSIAVAGSILRSLFAALVAGLAAGVGAWAAARQAPRPRTARLPPSIAGIAAACFAAGVGAIAARFMPSFAPRWPAFGAESLSLPWLGAALAGARLVAAIGVGLFVLHGLSRLTSGWRRRGGIAALTVVAVVAAVALFGATDSPAAAAAGMATGAAVVAVVYGVLRFDYLAVPAFVGTGAVLDFVAGALQKNSPVAYANAGIAIAVSVLVTLAATRYLARARVGAMAPLPAAP